MSTPFQFLLDDPTGWDNAYPGGYQSAPQGYATPILRPEDQFWNGPMEGPMQTRSWPPSIYGQQDPAQDFWNWLSSSPWGGY